MLIYIGVNVLMDDQPAEPNGSDVFHNTAVSVAAQ